MTDPSSPLRPLAVEPKLKPPFDPGFRPAILAYQAYQDEVRASGRAIPLKIAVERESGRTSCFETMILPWDAASGPSTFHLVERLAKFLLWSRGGWRIRIQGPSEIAERLGRAYAEGGERAFDAELMGRVYEKKFRVETVDDRAFPRACENESLLGGHLDGCRIGFDLGASDFKVAAVRDGDPVFSEEIPWAPQAEADPAYHYGRIQEGLRLAASHLPRVEAIGGSAAGIYINNQVRIASLFRAVPVDVFEREVKTMFLRIGAEWGVPLEVINDGEVTALAGTLSLGEKAMLGVAMGSSQAGGFLNAQGFIPGWLDELAFVPVDFAPEGAVDEWSGDRGVGAMYFSQQAVNKLALAAGFRFAPAEKLPERLKAVQEAAEKGDGRAEAIFEAVGVYLGYTIPLYALFYDYRNLLILGRVTSGLGGDIIARKAKAVLAAEFPEAARTIALHLLDEKSRRVGQAVAAASLPALAGRRPQEEPR